MTYSISTLGAGLILVKLVSVEEFLLDSVWSCQVYVSWISLMLTVGVEWHSLPVQFVGFSKKWVERLSNTFPIRSRRRHRECRNQLKRTKTCQYQDPNIVRIVTVFLGSGKFLLFNVGYTCTICLFKPLPSFLPPSIHPSIHSSSNPTIRSVTSADIHSLRNYLFIFLNWNWILRLYKIIIIASFRSL